MYMSYLLDPPKRATLDVTSFHLVVLFSPHWTRLRFREHGKGKTSGHSHHDRSKPGTSRATKSGIASRQIEPCQPLSSPSQAHARQLTTTTDSFKAVNADVPGKFHTRPTTMTFLVQFNANKCLEYPLRCLDRQLDDGKAEILRRWLNEGKLFPSKLC